MSGIVDGAPSGLTSGMRILISETEIRLRVRELGAEIAADHPDGSRRLVILGILKGAAVLLADLVRATPREVEYDFVAFSSYGSGTRSAETVRVLKGLDGDYSGKDVVVVEDILDTGRTLENTGLITELRDRGATSVRLCALLDKACRRQAAIPLHYRGFEIDNHFVVGYGMDYAERYRNLPYIAVLPPDTGAAER